jgi:hypothetical protein
MYRIVELEIDPELTGQTGVFEVAWVESPATEQMMMVFAKENFYKVTDEIAENACRAIEENEKRGNPAATMVGKIRARQLCGKQEISLDVVKRMYSYLSRAATYNSGNWDDNGTISYNLWGGEPALNWSKRIIEQAENQEMAKIGERGGITESPKAPKSDTPNRNPEGEGSAKGSASTSRGADVSARAEETLKNKSDDFNERYKDKLGYGVNVGMLKSVYQRGLGAYNTSHSPNVRSAEQWAQARVNAFLYLVRNGRPQNPKYVNDFDLLPSEHPKKEKMTSQEFVYPNAGEKEGDYISRCISSLEMMDEFPDEKQRAAVCYSYWRKKEEFALQKVSFDYDGVLTTARGREFLKNEIRNGNEVHIITARSRAPQELLDLAKDYGLSVYRIHTTSSNKGKVDLIKKLGIKRHYDDNPNVRLDLPNIAFDFDYDVSSLPAYVNYPDSGDTNSMLVKPFDFQNGLDVFGYTTKNFDICPGAQATFTHLVSMNPDDETKGMIRSAAQIADNVFEIEKNVLEKNAASPDELEEVILLVDDFKDLIHEIDEEVGMVHNVDYMDGHIQVVREKLQNTYEYNVDLWDEEDQQAHFLFQRIRETQPQEFERITNPLLRGFTATEIFAMNHKTPTIYYQYQKKVTATEGGDSRDFCESLVDRYFRISQIYALENTNLEFGHNRQPYSKLIYKGGPECVHAFRKYTFERKNKVDMGWAPGRAGEAPREMEFQGYYSEETRARSKRAYAISQKSQGFSQTFLTEKEYDCVFGCDCSIGFNKTEEQLFASVNEKRMIYTPLMIPKILIPRIDEATREKYYVRFTPETIQNIQRKFMIQQRLRDTNLEHSDKKFKDVVMVESWIVEGDNDKAYELGFTKDQVPKGTWMGGYYVLSTPEGDEVWNNYVKTKKVRGSSVEGDFIMNFSAIQDDDYLLAQIINILKNITE